MADSWHGGLVMADSWPHGLGLVDHPELKGKNRPEGMGTKPGWVGVRAISPVQKFQDSSFQGSCLSSPAKPRISRDTGLKLKVIFKEKHTAYFSVYYVVFLVLSKCLLTRVCEIGMNYIFQATFLNLQYNNTSKIICITHISKRAIFI